MLNSYQMKAAEKVVAERIPMLKREAEKGSTAIVGKFAECMRVVLNARPTDILRCRAANRVDMRIGRNDTYEIKTGSGAVAYAESKACGYFTAEDRIPENILPGVKYVIWFPFSGTCITAAEILAIKTVEDFLRVMEKMLRNSWVFTRDEFIECLQYIGKHGLASSLKLSKNGTQINIQTISHKLEDRLWEVLEHTPTADTLLK